MRNEWIAAERRAEVRAAAKAWLKAEAIDETAYAAIEDLYPDKRPQPAFVWKLLVSFFVSAAAIGIFLALENSFRPSEGGRSLLALSLALLLGGATEMLFRSLRLSGNGVEAATSFWSVVFFQIASWASLEHLRVDSVEAATIWLAVSVLLWIAACKRWGYPAYAALASVFGFLFLARLTGGRFGWLLVGCLLAAAGARLLDRSGLPPSRRRASAAVLVVSLLAVYAAVNLYSLDKGLIESIATEPLPVPRHAARLLAGLATAIAPLALFVWGVRTRRTILLDVAILTTALSLLTLQHYAKLRPVWAVLLVAGSAVVAVAAWIGRRLAKSPRGERLGITADRLFENQEIQGVIESAAVAAVLAPAAEIRAAEDTHGFRGGGGGSGGGGASGHY